MANSELTTGRQALMQNVHRTHDMELSYPDKVWAWNLELLVRLQQAKGGNVDTIICIQHAETHEEHASLLLHEFCADMRRVELTWGEESCFIRLHPGTFGHIVLQSWYCMPEVRRLIDEIDEDDVLSEETCNSTQELPDLANPSKDGQDVSLALTAPTFFSVPHVVLLNACMAAGTITRGVPSALCHPVTVHMPKFGSAHSTTLVVSSTTLAQLDLFWRCNLQLPKARPTDVKGQPLTLAAPAPPPACSPTFKALQAATPKLLACLGMKLVEPADTSLTPTITPITCSVASATFDMAHVTLCQSAPGCINMSQLPAVGVWSISDPGAATSKVPQSLIDTTPGRHTSEMLVCADIGATHGLKMDPQPRRSLGQKKAAKVLRKKEREAAAAAAALLSTPTQTAPKDCGSTLISPTSVPHPPAGRLTTPAVVHAAAVAAVVPTKVVPNEKGSSEPEAVQGLTRRQRKRAKAQDNKDVSLALTAPTFFSVPHVVLLNACMAAGTITRVVPSSLCHPVTVHMPKFGSAHSTTMVVTSTTLAQLDLFWRRVQMPKARPTDVEGQSLTLAAPALHPTRPPAFEALQAATPKLLASLGMKLMEPADTSLTPTITPITCSVASATFDMAHVTLRQSDPGCIRTSQLPAVGVWSISDAGAATAKVPQSLVDTTPGLHTSEMLVCADIGATHGLKMDPQPRRSLGQKKAAKVLRKKEREAAAAAAALLSTPTQTAPKDCASTLISPTSVPHPPAGRLITPAVVHGAAVATVVPTKVVPNEKGSSEPEAVQGLARRQRKRAKAQGNKGHEATAKVVATAPEPAPVYTSTPSPVYLGKGAAKKAVPASKKLPAAMKKPSLPTPPAQVSTTTLTTPTLTACPEQNIVGIVKERTVFNSSAPGAAAAPAPTRTSAQPMAMGVASTSPLACSSGRTGGPQVKPTQGIAPQRHASQLATLTPILTEAAIDEACRLWSLQNAKASTEHAAMKNGKPFIEQGALKNPKRQSAAASVSNEEARKARIAAARLKEEASLRDFFTANRTGLWYELTHCNISEATLSALSVASAGV